jgi:hypothetical protein
LTADQQGSELCGVAGRPFFCGDDSNRANREEHMIAKYFPIEVVDAHGNNLKNVSLTIEKHQIVVFVGPSGSGKSSLVFDTIAAESQSSSMKPIPVSFGTGCRTTATRTPLPCAISRRPLSWTSGGSAAMQGRPWEPPPTSMPCFGFCFPGPECRW